MNNLDDFLNSMGISAEEPQSAQEEVVHQEAIIESAEEPVTHEPETQSLSQNDFDDILSEMGFTETPPEVFDEIAEEESEREEVVENTDSSEEYNENIGEGRDLDAEEDAEWEERIDSGEISPVETESGVATAPREPLLQPNSPTLLMDTSTSRFSGTEWYSEIQKQRVIIAGIGGIGSNCSFQIARMIPASMVLYDDDTVETVNMSGQLFSVEDVGKSKVDAMIDMITKYTSMRNIYAAKQKFDSTCEAGDIMICGFDNMAARKTFYEAWHNHVVQKPSEERKKCLFIDGRLSINVLQVFALSGDDAMNQAIYRDKYLFDDSEAEVTVCSMKQTTYLACMIGSIMVNLFTNFTANLLDPIIPYDLPFFTEYDAQNMIFKTEK